MAAIASIGGPSPGLGGLPTPVLLALVGGGIGAVVLLRRKMGSSGSGTPADKATLLPNTAIMLGSLQQSLLDLKGQVGSGQADLSTQLTGAQENIGAQIDALTSQEQQGLTDLQGNLTGTINTGVGNLSGSLSKLLSGQDAISQMIGQNAAAQQTYNKTFSDSVQSGFDTLVASHNAELAALNTITGGIGTIGSNLNTAEGQINAIGSAVGGLQQTVGGLKTVQTNPAYNMPSNSQLPSTLNDKLIWSNTDNNYYYAERGHLYGVNWGWANQHFDTSQAIKTDTSLAHQVDAYLGA